MEVAVDPLSLDRLPGNAQLRIAKVRRAADRPVIRLEILRNGGTAVVDGSRWLLLLRGRHRCQRAAAGFCINV